MRGWGGDTRSLLKPSGHRIGAMRFIRLALAAGLTLMLMAAPAQAAALADAQAGEEAHERGELKKAVELYSKAIAVGELSPQDLAGVYNNRGQAWRLLGDLNRALADHDKAISLDPRLPLAYNSRGIVWEKKGDLNRALADFTRAIELKPDYPSAYYNRSGLYERMGRLDESLADVKKFIQLEPKHPWGEKRLKELTAKIKGDK